MCERIPIAGDRGRHAIDVVVELGNDGLPLAPRGNCI